MAASPTSTPTPKLWVRSEPFDFALVQSPPADRLTHQALRKLCTVVRAKTRSSSPTHDWLSFSLWKSFAVNKLQLTSEVAWAYFESCNTLAPTSETDRSDWRRQLAACTTDEDVDLLRRQANVSLTTFILFLIIQLQSQVSLRTLSLQDVAFGSRGPPLRAATAKTTEEYLQIQFLLKELPQMLQLLSSPDSAGSSTSSLMELTIQEATVRSLGFLLEGTLDGKRIQPVGDLARAQSQVAKSGYSKITQAFSVSKLQSWIQSCLNANPFGVDACIAKRRLTSPSTPPPLPGPHVLPLTVGKTASNRLYAPKSHRLVLFSQVTGQTLVRDSSDIAQCGVVIKRCNNSTFYLLAPMRFVRVERCRSVTLVFGAVQNFVKLSHCQEAKLYTVAGQLHVSDCSDSVLYTSTPSRPLLLYGNRGITMAPYNTCYPHLKEDMAAVGLTGVPDQWNKPLCTSPALAQAAEKDADDVKGFKLIEPSDFFAFAVPFTMEGSTKVSPIRLPDVYKKALKDKEERAADVRVALQALLEGETDEKKSAFLAASREAFKEWLREKGHLQEITDLAALQRATASAPSDGASASGGAQRGPPGSQQTNNPMSGFL